MLMKYVWITFNSYLIFAFLSSMIVFQIIKRWPFSDLTRMQTDTISRHAIR
jgi:hypothetical protein